MRKGTVIILFVLMAALLVSDVSALAFAGSWNQAAAAGAGWRSSASTFTGQANIAVDNPGGRDWAAGAGVAAARARGGDAAAAESLSVGLAFAI